jgi:hypothetical protein
VAVSDVEPVIELSVLLERLEDWMGPEDLRYLALFVLAVNSPTQIRLVSSVNSNMICPVEVALESLPKLTR